MDEWPNLCYPIPYQNEEIWPEKQWQWKKECTLAALANDSLVFLRPSVDPTRGTLRAGVNAAY